MLKGRSALGSNDHPIKANTNTNLCIMLFNACKDIGPGVNTGKTKYTEVGRHRGVMTNERVRIGNSY